VLPRGSPDPGPGGGLHALLAQQPGGRGEKRSSDMEQCGLGGVGRNNEKRRKEVI
jgi:hypothetical protein